MNSSRSLGIIPWTDWVYGNGDRRRRMRRYHGTTEDAFEVGSVFDKADKMRRWPSLCSHNEICLKEKEENTCKQKTNWIYD